MTQKLKILTILGTRPEIIRLSRILPKMDEYFNHVIVHTRQSYDFELSKIFFEELELRKPDYLLEVKSDTLGGQIGNILKQTEEVMKKEKPDAILILGDTNSSLSAIMAKRLGILIFHMEAGSRCFDFEVAEETNRALVDVISDYNVPYTQRSKEYLIHSGIHPRTILVTGSPLAEVYDFFKEKIDSSSIIEDLDLKPNQYFVVSAHREENVDNPANLKELFESLNFLTDLYKLPIIITLHPRTKKRLSDNKIKINPKILLHKPFGILEYIKLEQNSLCTISDSGTIQEESSILGFNAIQIRANLERPEAFDKGAIILAGLNKNTIVNAIEMTIKEKELGQKIVTPDDYKDINVSSKVVRLIMGLSAAKKYHNKAPHGF
ncbi:UDP-N-acetylglucosamine 2-epimerase (non-hydrolyzing) [Candidatus Daviesbacteria bacterium]|nr:UDP-N-acetylglucosamine 2-epimerase (non-hydrolyzing) [Candidatus Daviesbacteria bacterium]